MNRFRWIRLLALVAVWGVFASAQTLSSSANPSILGQSITLTANRSGGYSGYVLFYDGSTQIGTNSVDGMGTATLQISTLSLGTHSLVAYFCFESCDYTTNMVSQVVKATCGIGLSSAPNPSNPGQTVTVTATLSPSVMSPAPGGTVSFFSDGLPVPPYDVNVIAGTATYTTSTLPVGSHTLTAFYNGDGNFFGSSSAPATQTVQPFLTNTNISSMPNPSIFGQTVTLSANVLPSSATGSVQFVDVDTSQIYGTASLSNGTASIGTGALTVGVHGIQANFLGSTNYLSSTSPAVNQTVNKIPTSTLLSSSENPSIAGDLLTLTATVSPSAATGFVTFMDGAATLGTVGLSGGIAKISPPNPGPGLAAFAPGSHNLQAFYKGNEDYATSNGSLTQIVNKIPTSLTLLGMPNPAQVGQTVTLSATLGGPGPTGSVTFYDNGNQIGAGNVSGLTATFTTNNLTVGSHTLNATYGGDTNYALSQSNTVIEAVSLQSTTITLVANPQPSTAGQSVTLTATVTPSTATGTVTFLDGVNSLGAIALSNGAAILATNNLTVGSHSLTASYSGDSTFALSQSFALTQTVTAQSTTTTLAATPNPSAVSQSVTLTATVTPATATGTVAFFDGASSLGVITLFNGAATLTGTSFTAGGHTLTATYNGDASDAPSTSQPVTQTVAPAGPRTITSLSPNTAAAGSPPFTLTVNGTGFSPGATVQWNPTALVTTFVSSTQVTAAVPATLLASTGTAIVTVATAGGATAGAPFTVNLPGQSCSFTVAVFSASFAASGGSGSIAVTASRNDCTWTAATTVPWISGFNTLTGSGTLGYTVSPNTTATGRTGTIAIGAQSFIVIQAGTNCIESLPFASQVFIAAGGGGTASVQAPPGCPWTAGSGASWVIITPPAGGSGNGTVAYTVTANPSSTPRATTLVIANQPYTVTQVGSGTTVSCTGSVPSAPQVALEGRTEMLGDYLLQCRGLTGPVVTDIVLTLNTSVTNQLTNNVPDAVLTVNGVPTAQSARVMGYNIVRWPGITIQPAADGTALVRISKVRADASLYALPGNLQPTSITGQIGLDSLSPVPVVNAVQTMAMAAPSLIFTRIQAAPPTGGAQALLPAVFQEAAATSFQASVTRLRVVLSNVPATVQVYAPIFPAEGANRAQLYNADSSGFGGTPLPGIPFAGGQYQQLILSGGSATATWLVLTADATQIETWTFSLLFVNALTGDLNQIQVTGTLAPVSLVIKADATAPVPRYQDPSNPPSPVDVRVTHSKTAVVPGADPSAGSNYSNTVAATNNSSTPLTNATIGGNISSGQNPLSCTTTCMSCSLSGNQYQAACGTLNPGATASVTIMTQVPPSTPPGTPLDDSADVSGDQPSQDPFSTNSDAGYIALSGSPVVVAETPAAGAAGAQTFTFQFSHPSGYQFLNVVNVLINNFLDGRNACYLAYSVPLATLYLVNDGGHSEGLYAGSVPLGSTSTIQNSQCAVNLVSAAGNGTTLTLVLNIAFTPAFGGNRILYTAAGDLAQANTNWQALAVWQALPFTPPGSIAVTGLAPARGAAASGANQQLMLTLTDSKGFGDFGIVDVLINNFIDGRQACYLAYAASGNILYLVDDAGDAGGPFAGSMALNGGSGSMQNSQCMVSGTGSAIMPGPGTLSLTLNITFKASFAGNRVIYAAGRDTAGGNNTDWQAVGTWTVQ